VCQTDGRTDGIAIAYARYSICCRAQKALRFMDHYYTHARICAKMYRMTYYFFQGVRKGSTRHQTWSLSSATPSPVQSRLRITNRSFRYTAPQLWNKLPHSLRVPYQSGSSLSSPMSSGSNPGPAVNLSHGMFHSRLKTYLFSKSFPP